MSESESKMWQKYHEKTKEIPPRELLVESLQFVQNRDEALDLGAGPLTDSNYLINEGFQHVTAVDIEPTIKDRNSNNKIDVVISKFEDLDLPTEKYDLVTSQWALSFTHPDRFNETMEKIIASLRKEGVITGQFFGDRDGWSDNPEMSFVTEDKAREILKELEILKFHEQDNNGRLVNGNPKHWHVFHFIARKK